MRHEPRQSGRRKEGDYPEVARRFEHVIRDYMKRDKSRALPKPQRIELIKAILRNLKKLPDDASPNDIAAVLEKSFIQATEEPPSTYPGASALPETTADQSALPAVTFEVRANLDECVPTITIPAEREDVEPQKS